MILYFGRSRAIFYTGLAATAALALAVAYRRADGPFWLLILTVSLVAIVGSAVTTLVANIAAASCESRVLEKLHIALEPEEFISLYEKAARGQKHGSAQSVVGLASLADGYCAAGDWRRALKTLEEPGEAVPQAKRAALTALVKRNRCRYTLWGGNPKEARAALASFEKQLDSLKEQNPKARLAEGAEPEARGKLRLGREALRNVDGPARRRQSRHGGARRDDAPHADEACEIRPLPDAHRRRSRGTLLAHVRRRGRTPGAREGFAEEVRVNARRQSTRLRIKENAAQNIGKALLYTRLCAVRRVPCGCVS